MIRKIIKIDEKKCNGCGACASACHEGAIAMVDGTARLIRDDYCDGLGDCLPTCPAGAITFEEREAAAYDHAAVLAKEAAKKAAGLAGAGQKATPAKEGASCVQAARLIRNSENAGDSENACPAPALKSCLSQWPVQIKLAPLTAPYYENARLLIAADCTAYAYGNFHKAFIDGRITLVGCPKLDMVDYSEKLKEIISRNEIRDVTVVRMEVPCCGGIEHAVKQALMDSGKFLPWQVVTIGTDGRILK